MTTYKLTEQGLGYGIGKCPVCETIQFVRPTLTMAAHAINRKPCEGFGKHPL